ncbi:MAG: hypothetical protein MR555_06410 [Spirochaetia bacterium]|nr:hypothetical protein [Spirochaetia bacterium]
MKKLFAFISLLLATTAMIFADVTVKKLDNGTAEVTFFYGNPRATEVLLAGDFNNWQNGAEAMTKTDKGFTITKIFKVTDELRYKFISDGNWTTDLKAPDFVDDGFGGKNSHVVIADMLGGDDDAAAAKAKINFISWSMIGVQAGYKTQGASDATKKGLDLDNVSVGFKSYNKFVGNFLPNCPLYIEIALAESDLENYDGNQKINYLYQKNAYDVVTVDFADGIRNFLSGIFADPVHYLAQSTDNSVSENGTTIPGPGSRPFLGHLKFGFNTPYVNFLTGFNYAKPDVRQAITWKTVTGNWDAGYHHVGGFNVFSLGSKAAATLEEATGLVWDVGFAPNKTADRKGTKYGYWGWAGVKNDTFAIDFQTNGMYDGEYLFTDPVEHDFIIGAKMPQIEVGDGKLNWALQALLATHQKEFLNGASDNAVDYFGYSTDIWYRTANMDNFAEKLAANVQVGYKAETFGVNLEYRMRGAQASMLYVRENHDDATFDLSDELGVANEQRIAFNGFVNCGDAATIDLGVKAKMPLIKYAADDELVVQSRAARPSWYDARFDDNQALLYNGENGGVELFFEPAVTVKLSDNISLNAYGDMKFKSYSYMEGIDKDEANKYTASDSSFLFKKGGVSAIIGFDSDFFKSVNVYAGVDNGNSIRMMETLVGQANFANDFVATLAFGVKHYKETDAKKAAIADEGVNNPFAFAVGVAKRFKAMKKPTVYAQFVYNMDPFKHFGDGQDQLNLDRANVKGSVEKEGAGNIDAVNWYDGRAAVRVGVRWDI